MTVTIRAVRDLLTAAIFNTKVEAPILTDELAAGAVTSVKLADGAVSGGKMGVQPAARAYHTAAQAVAHNAYTPLALNSERFDTDAIHDPATNNSRLTAKTAGLYQISGNIQFTANTAGFRVIAIRLNGSVYIAQNDSVPNASFGHTITIATAYPLAVNDYIELMAYQNSGVSLDISAVSNYSPECTIVRAGG